MDTPRTEHSPKSRRAFMPFALGPVDVRMLVTSTIIESRNRRERPQNKFVSMAMN